MMRARCGLGLLCLLVISVGAHGKPPPISAFAKLEQFVAPAISPDGRYLSYLAENESDRTAVVFDLHRPESVPTVVLRAASKDGLDIAWCRWANNSRLLCDQRETDQGFLHVDLRAKIIGVNADGSNTKVLLDYKFRGVRIDQGLGGLVDITPDDPDTVLVASAEVGKHAKFPSVYKLNVYDGKLELHTPAFPPILGFLSDGRGNVRLGIGVSGASFVYFSQLQGEQGWRSLAGVKYVYQLQSIVPGTDKAYGFLSTDGRQALYKIDLRGSDQPEYVYSHPAVDLAGLLASSEIGQVSGVWYETDRPFAYYTDDAIAAKMRAVNEMLRDTFNVPVAFTHDRKKMVIRASSDVEAGAYYQFDIGAGQLTLIGKTHPQLDAEQLPRMQSIEYKAADGTPIPGYLTLPLAESHSDSLRERVKPPLIVMPHGGPIMRDHWAYDFLRHFLVSRGYAVLQMNFRGSTGYGYKWRDAAKQDWGGLTYSDIADGTRWAMTQGTVDPERVCIVGWSFGGYAALVGAMRNPDLFKCAASIAGVSDLVSFKAFVRRGANAELAENLLGSDADKLRADSPVQHAADFKIPVLLVHGTLDTRSRHWQTREMARALKKAHKDFKLVELEGADHNLLRESDRTILLTELEQFLATKIGSSAQPTVMRQE